MRVLAVDPGRDKCGVAVAEPGHVLHRAVVAPAEVAAEARALLARYGAERVLVGGGTGSAAVVEALAGAGVVAAVVPERHTTLRARARYFAEHPPRGWRRLVPRSLQVPAEPYDDYAAAVIAEDYLAALAGSSK